MSERLDEMFKNLGITTLALAAALTVAAPTVTLARDRDDRNFRNDERREEHHEVRRDRDFRDRDQYQNRDRDRDSRFSFGFGFNADPRGYAPAQNASGYYDRYGNWHSNGFYDQWGNWHSEDRYDRQFNQRNDRRRSEY